MAVYKQKNGTWQVRMRSSEGRQVTKRGFATKREAQAWESDSKRKMTTGSWTAASGGRVTVREVFEPWLVAKRITERTKHDYKEVWSNLVAPWWATKQLRDVSPTGVTRWIADMSAQHSAARVRKAHAILNQTLDWAVADNLIPANPVERAKILANGELLPRVRREKEPVFLTAQQVRDLSDLVDGHYRLFVLTAAWTGLRFGEITELRVRDVDLLAKRIHVRRAVSDVGGRLVVGATKGGQERVVPILSSISGGLSEAIGRAGSPDELLFATKGGAQIRYRRFRADVFDPAVKAAGLSGLTPHGLRHTYAALAVQAGANPRLLMQALGHSDIRLTLQTYGGLFGDDLDALAERLDDVAMGPSREADVVNLLSGRPSGTSD
jgi:integrase